MGEKEAKEQEPKTGFFRRYRRAMIAAGLAGLAVGGFVGYKHFERTGEVKSYQAKTPQPANIDNQVAIGSWNMHNEAAARVKQIRLLANKHRLDVMMMQEVNTEDVQMLRARFKTWNVAFVLADARQEFDSGGYGNVIMSRQKLESVSGLGINGDSVMDYATKTLAEGTIDMVNLDTSFPRSKEAPRENRAGLAATVRAYDGNQLRKIRAVTFHIGGQKDVNAPQLKTVFNWSKENTAKDQTTVACGDLNAGPDRVLVPFAGYGFYTPQTGPTTKNNGAPIDYCAVNNGEVLGTPKVEVDRDFYTDHYAIVAKFALKNVD